MKRFLIPGVAMAGLLVGCSSTPVALAPVGPGPLAPQAAASNAGSLEVYSPLVPRSEGDNPAWYQHTDYYLSGANGQENRRINNTVGYYEQRPRTVGLAPGTYLVESKTSTWQPVEVPVVIKPGETTVVHLDHGWNASGAPVTEIVTTPNGAPVGWRAGLAPTGRDD